jgi:hypothetical protein
MRKVNGDAKNKLPVMRKRNNPMRNINNQCEKQISDAKSTITNGVDYHG